VAANQAAVRAGQAARLNGTVPVELHLPCVDRRGADEFAVRGPDAPARILPDGAVLLQDPDLYQSRLVASVALNSPRDTPQVPFYLRFADRRTCSTAAAVHQLQPVLARYGLPEEALRWISDRGAESFDICLLVRLRSSAIETWSTVAGPRQAAFHDQFRLVSQAVQESLRTWLPYLYFQDDERFRVTRLAYPMLVYAFMKPFRGGFRSDYCYDPTDRVSIQKALWGVMPQLEVEMKRLAPRLSAMGLSHADQIQYSGRRAPTMVKAASDSHRLFGALLFAEHQIIETLVAFASEVHKGVRNQTPVSPVKMGTNLHRKLRKRLRRVYGTLDASGLISMLLLEATAPLAAAQGLASPIEAMIRIRARPDGSEYYAVNSEFRG
jgi:hypothetical protein